MKKPFQSGANSNPPPPQPTEPSLAETPISELEEEERKDRLGVPVFTVKSSAVDNEITLNIIAMGLPTVEEIEEALGLGPNGPPPPPPALFSVTRMPVKRRDIEEPPKHFVFVASSADDP